MQGPEKGGGQGFPQPKGLPLCLGVGAGCEDPGGRLRCAWRPGLPEDLRICVRPQVIHAECPLQSSLLPSSDLTLIPHVPSPSLLTVVVPVRPSQGQLSMGRSPGLVARPLLVPTQQGPWTSSPIPPSPRAARAQPNPSQNLAFNFKASDDSTQALTRKDALEVSPLTPPGPVHPYLLPSAEWQQVKLWPSIFLESCCSKGPQEFSTIYR